jgi:hypothetical protein
MTCSPMTVGTISIAATVREYQNFRTSIFFFNLIDLGHGTAHKKRRFYNFINFRVNPNPHGLKAITKLTASGLKEPLLPIPCTALWGEGGRGSPPRQP